jgi:phosphoglycolate phosphatase
VAAKKSLFIDLDGPILDVSARHFRVCADILTMLGNPPSVKNSATYWKMKRNGDSLAVILRKLSKSPVDEAVFSYQWLQRIEQLEYLRLDRVPRFARTQLPKLCEKFDLVLVTLRQCRETLDAQLKELQLFYFFHCILSRTPSRSGTWELKRDLIASSGLLYADSWIIGDSEVDILAGKALGMKTIAVLSGIRNSAVLKEVAPDFIVKDLNHLPSLD